MRTVFTNAALAATLALAACTGTSETPVLTPDDQARASYDGIVSGANVLLLGDQLAHSATDDEVERVPVRCRGGVCYTGTALASHVGGFNVEDAELELLGERRGVSVVAERGSNDYRDIYAYGGWLDHSLFATEARELKHPGHPNHGATVVSNYSLGFSTGENPSAAEGSARWQGLMVGRDMSASPRRGQVLRGDADVTVDFGPSAIMADVEFTDIVNIETGDARNDMAWRGMTIEKGRFAMRNAPDDTISGRFYGPNEEEVGGVFERDSVAGSFGGKRTSP